MHLRSVIGAMVDSGSDCLLAVSTIGGKKRDDIRLESTALERFSPDDSVACIRQYQRWKIAAQKGSAAQRIDAPGQPMRASFGMQEGPGVAKAYGHMLRAIVSDTETKYPHTKPVLDEIRAKAVRSIYAAMRDVFEIEVGIPENDMLPADFTMPFYQVIDHPGIDIGVVQMPKMLQELVKRANGGDARSMQALRDYAQERGYEIAKREEAFLPPGHALPAHSEIERSGIHRSASFRSAEIFRQGNLPAHGMETAPVREVHR